MALLIQRTPEERKVSGYIEITLLAQAAGVSTSAVAAWVKRNAGNSVLRKIKGTRNVPYWLADRYLHNKGVKRLATRPRGWVTIKALAIDLGLDEKTLRKWANELNLRIKQYQVSLFMPPGDAEVLTQAVKEMKPLAGWVSIKELTDTHGYHRAVIHKAVKDLSFEARTFKEPDKRPRSYIHRHDAEQVVSFLKQTHKGKLSNWHVVRMRRLAFVGWKISEIAVMLGVTEGQAAPFITGHNRPEAGGPIRGVHYKYNYFEQKEKRRRLGVDD